MKKIWAKPQIDTFYAMMTKDEMNLLFEEWAEVVYNYLCQLSESQPEVSETLNQKRTGTDG